MQFGHALDRTLREVLLANPAHGPAHLKKTDLMAGAPDGVVEVFLLPGSNKPDKTKVIKSTTDPVFNDNFQFQANFETCYVC